MEIIGTNVQEKDMKSKKIMKIITIIIILLLITSIALLGAIYYLKEQEFKFELDGKVTSQYEADLFVYENDKLYISLKDVAGLINYKYYNGGYKQYSEDLTSGYLEGIYEVCTFEKDSNLIYKTPVDEIDYQSFTLEEPIKMMSNNKLYISAEGLSNACNLQISYSKNKVTIYTLPYLTNYYTLQSKYSAIGESFNNQKAVLYNLLVVQNVENTTTDYNKNDIRYGIYTLDGKEIVGMKYTNIEFIESTREFIVTTEENKVGIITSNGETKVRPQYDALKQIDKDLNLYLATSNNKKGIIEKNGKILIYLEYDEIGIDTTKFTNNNIKNGYILFDNAIPVKQNGKWGLYDIRGNVILPIEYEEIGCIANNKNLNNVVVIPEVKGIVISKEYILQENKKVILYGIVNSEGRELVAAGLETVYSVTSNGRDEFTMVYNGEIINVIDYINRYVDIEVENKENQNQNQN